MTDDADLLRRYAETRSESAFTELVERYIDLVHTAALRRLGGDSHRAADVAQQVFIALARHAQTLSRRPVLVGWLYTTTRHAVLDNLRAEKRRLMREHASYEFQAMSESDTIAEEWKELRPLLDLAMDELGSSEREVILLRFFEERSFVELGAKFSITEDTARMRTHRALEKLHRLLQRRGITSTAAALGSTLAAQSIVAAPAGLAAAVASGAVLAIASTGTASLAGAGLAFMTTSKMFQLGAALAFLAVTGAALYEARLARQTGNAMAATTRERDTLRTQTAALEARLRETSADLTRVTALQKKPKRTWLKPTPCPKSRLDPVRMSLGQIRRLAETMSRNSALRSASVLACSIDSCIFRPNRFQNSKIAKLNSGRKWSTFGAKRLHEVYPPRGLPSRD